MKKKTLCMYKVKYMKRLYQKSSTRNAVLEEAKEDWLKDNVFYIILYLRIRKNLVTGRGGGIARQLCAMWGIYRCPAIQKCFCRKTEIPCKQRKHESGGEIAWQISFSLPYRLYTCTSSVIGNLWDNSLAIHAQANVECYSAVVFFYVYLLTFFIS